MEQQPSSHNHVSCSQLIYKAAGSPSIKSSASGVCRVCGSQGAGISFEEWVRDSFTDRDKLQPGEIICRSCLFCFDERSTLLTKLTRKLKPQRMRNYSHFVVGDKWYPLSKGQKPQIRELLFACPSVAVIAESGQKHIIFRAQAGWLQFEEQRTLLHPGRIKAMLELVETLYQAGASKIQIASGHYSQSVIRTIGVEQWSAMEARIRPQRGSLVLSLALLLAQKEDGSDES
jgi:hypothetical protein